MSRPEIALQGVEPKFDSPEVGLQKALQLKDLMQTGQIQQQNIQLNKQAIDEKTAQAQQIVRAQKGQQLYAQLLENSVKMGPDGDLVVDHPAVEQGLYKGGYPELAQLHEQKRAEAEKLAYDVADKRLTAQSAQNKQLAQLAQSVLNAAPQDRGRLYMGALNQAVASKLIPPEAASQLPKEYTPDVDPELQRLSDMGTNDPAAALAARAKEKRDQAAADAKAKEDAATLEAKSTQNESTILGAARTPEAWTAALDRLPAERRSLYPPTFSEDARKNAVFMGMTPEQREATDSAKNEIDLVSKAARNEPGARAALKMLKEYNISLEDAKAQSQVKAQMGAFAPGGAAPVQPGGAAPVQPGGAKPLAAAPVQPGGRNEAYLASLPVPLQVTVKKLADGKMAFPGGFSLKSPYIQNLINAVGQYDPSFDAVNYNARAKTRQDFTSGKSANNITAINTAIEHAGQLESNIDGLGNFQIPLVNAVKNAVKSGVGQGGALNKFNNDVQAFTSEATRAWRQAGGSEADIAAWKKSLSSSDSPQALRDSLKEMTELLMGKVRSLHDQYTNGMGIDTSDIPMTTPRAQAVLGRLGVEGLPQGRAAAQPAPSGGKVITPDLLDKMRKANPGVSDADIIDGLVTQKGYAKPQ